MRITYKGDYALKTILDLAIHYGKGPVSIHDLARRQDMPVKFLEQILLALKRAGFVQSKRGKVGGYFLAKFPAEIKVGDVVRFIDGPAEPIACVNRKYKECRDLRSCAFRAIWQEVAEATHRIIDSVTFEDLVKKSSANNLAAEYHI